MINARTLALMKPDAYLINTARGTIVDEKALVEALREKRIAGAAIDVYDPEPPRPGNPLLQSGGFSLAKTTDHIVINRNLFLVSAQGPKCNALVDKRPGNPLLQSGGIVFPEARK